MGVKFQIESKFKLTGRGQIIAARIIEEGREFWMTDKSLLGGVEIKRWTDIPRALDENGEIRLDLWFFQLENDEDVVILEIDQVVELTPGTELKFWTPWVEIDSPEYYDNELVKEISLEHILSGKKFRAIARREDRDDVIYELEEGKYAVVHLTWSSSNKQPVNFPKTRIYDHWTDVYDKIIVQDHLEYEE